MKLFLTRIYADLQIRRVLNLMKVNISYVFDKSDICFSVCEHISRRLYVIVLVHCNYF